MVVGALALGAIAVPGASARILGAMGFAPATDPCSVTVLTETAQDNAIQTAVSAHPGGTICVGAGTFPEQLTISASGTTLKGAGPTKTIIEPTTVTFNTVDWDSAGQSGTSAPCGTSTCNPIASIILVESVTPPPASAPTTGVTIEDLEVNGAAASSTANLGCGNGYVGVDFQDAAGTLTITDVVNVAPPTTTCFGDQETPGAVYAYNGYFYAKTAPAAPVAVTVSHTTVTGYQKNGVTCDDPEEVCALSANVIAGYGPTTLTGQNGVQVGFGALGTLTSNSVTGNSYTGSTSSNDWYGPTGTYAASGILLYDSASGTTVTSNAVSLNQIGIVYYDDGAYDAGAAITTISRNVVTVSNAYAIVASGAPGGHDTVVIGSNGINNGRSLNANIWGAPGILVDTGTFLLTSNTIVGSSILSGASNGASQIVCNPGGTYAGTCPSTISLPTAAIQGASESGSDPTNVTLGGIASTWNSYLYNSNDLETVGVLGGSVNLNWE